MLFSFFFKKGEITGNGNDLVEKESFMTGEKGHFWSNVSE